MERAERRAERGMPEHLAAYNRLQDDLVKAAQVARDKAVSYRGFKVGCAALAWKRGPKNEYLVRAAGNVTPAPGQGKGSAKRCAERNALEAALRDNPEIIVAITSVSRESNTEAPSVAHDVLHPCFDCRQLLRELKSKGIMRDETVIHSVNDAGEPNSAIVEPTADLLMVSEERTLKELLDLYPKDADQAA